MATRLVGTNYITPDIVAKVTGRARYAEDYRAEGMLFCKLMLSERPHARVLGKDLSRALALPGVRAILTAEDVPQLGGTTEHCLTNEPLYAGEPILAVAAVSEEIAADAIELIRLDLEPLPFVTDPIESLRPGGPDARFEGNVWAPPRATRAGAAAPPKCHATEMDARLNSPRRPRAACRWARRWKSGHSAISKRASSRRRCVLDETFVVPSTGHHPLETRSAMAYWQNGKLHLHCSTQSVVRTVDAVARWVGIKPEDVVLICEYTGGGFGSKGGGAVSMAIPALLSKKANAPVMMRVSREEESYFGRARTNMVGPRQGRLRERRPHPRARHVHRAGQRAVWPDGRSPVGRQHRVADLSTGGDALARRERPDQHAAAHATALARSDAGQRDLRRRDDEGGETTRDRSDGHSPVELSGRQSAVRSPGCEGPAAAHHERIRERGARSRRAAVRLGGARRPFRHAGWLEGSWRGRDGGITSRRFESASTA